MEPEKTKIIIATPLFPPDIGGPATYSRILRDELPKYDIEPIIVSFGSVRHLPKILRHIAYFFKILFSSKGVDIIYGQDPVSVGLPALIASKILRKKFIVKIVGDYAWEQSVQRFNVKDLLDDFAQKKDYSLPVKVFKKIEKYVADSAELVIVPSFYLKKIVSLWGVDSEKIKVIYNAFEGVPNLGEKDKLREALGFSGPTIVSVGRLVPWKGFKDLIAIMPKLKDDFPRIRLVIIGSGPDREKLEDQASFLPKDTIHFTGQLSRYQTLQQLMAADVLVLNTAYEGLSHLLLEAMAVKVPIVTTSVGGNIELIENGVSGLLVPFNDQRAIKISITEILKNKSKTDSMTSKAYEKVCGFSVDKMVSSVSEVLHESN